jgi:hypothetical protein
LHLIFRVERTMKSFSVVVLLLAFIGLAAAFFRPATPIQVGESMPQGMGLDNESVPRDDKITPVSENDILTL